ncbi:MAG: hypothetical protein HY332_05545 [Chloroflexi bacterium]|nr:hypothetical protein [Chloroflexota bacterium]
MSRLPEAQGTDEHARRVLYCVPGVWTDEWYDDPRAWWQWCRAFLGWSPEEWNAFYARWCTAPERVRQEMMARNGVRFFDWQRVPGGSIRGSVADAADLMVGELANLPADADVTLLGHSKGGNVVKRLLASTWDWNGGAKPARAILVDAPVDWLRETVGRFLRLGIDRCDLSSRNCSVPVVTVNNWLDPSGGRLRGMRNYQTFVWQDYLQPYPPHGMKGFLAERVLRDVGAFPQTSSTPLPVF